MIVYHASPNDNIKELFDNSYVTLFPHIAYYMGLYYVNTKKTWSDNDLEKPYGFEKYIYFKKGRKPTGKPTLYKLKIDPDNIVMHKNFPFEFIIKKGCNITKIKEIYIKNIIIKSKKLLQLFDEINF